MPLQQPAERVEAKTMEPKGDSVALVSQQRRGENRGDKTARDTTAQAWVRLLAIG